MIETWKAWLFVLVLLVILFASILYTFVKSVRIRTMEYAFLLMFSFSPLGLVLQYGKNTGELNRSENWAPWIAVGLLPVAVLLIGGIIGLRWAAEKNEERSWARLGYIILGFQAAPGVILGPLSFVLTVIKIAAGSSVDPALTWKVVMLSWLGVPWILIIRFIKWYYYGDLPSEIPPD
ncbi:MAG: hypothetical protein HY291_00375 [Planctomycetes bacterium]|nr:hypothetical protein [Planctomycetota bacterium]